MQTETLYVELGERRYPIDVGHGLLADPVWLRERIGAGEFALVSNETVAPLYLDCLQAALGERLRAVRVLPDGEAFKTLETLSTIFDTLIDAGCDRQVTLIALGGGVVGDMTGFAAACWQRGVDFVQIPTTLLAQVDSSVGGKTAVNHPRGKNMIGAFHQPRLVIADTRTLDTLPAREFAAGLAEVVKYGVLGDAAFFRWLEANMARLLARDPLVLREAVVRSCRDKAEIVCADERESGRRALLNLGHTFGHAIEAATHYRRYLHGEAVAIGMVLAAELSCRLGWIDAGVPAALRALLRSAGLPVDLPADLEPDALLELMGHDKKAQGGRIRLVLLRALGDAIVTGEVPAAELRALLDAARTAPEPADG